MVCQIDLPTRWVDASILETAMSASPSPHETAVSEIIFKFPNGCKIMIDAAVRLLALFNQLEHCSRHVQLDFEEGDFGAMGYLNRMGFFDHLSRNIIIKQGWPALSGVELYGGMNPRLVEIAKINHQSRDDMLPTRLTNVLIQACANRSDVEELGDAAWTVFAELIDNIFSHSQTQLDGYAALQVYPKSHKLVVAVSDSGLGIMATLRPALKNEFPALANLSDIDLLVEIFRQGLSRHGSDRGCGLKGSAAKAIKFKADLDVRLPNIRILLSPGQDGYQPNTAYCYERLHLIWGTHICFNFRLDI
jgi:hypothetical protein